MGQMVVVKHIQLEGLKEDEVTTLMRKVDLVPALSSMKEWLKMRTCSISFLSECVLSEAIPKKTNF